MYYLFMDGILFYKYATEEEAQYSKKILMEGGINEESIKIKFICD